MSHDDKQNRDAQRERWLTDQGYRLVRVTNWDVNEDLEAVARFIAREAGMSIDEDRHPLSRWTGEGQGVTAARLRPLGARRHPDDRSSIGVFLCRARDRVTVEYALRDAGKPIGVSEYRVTEALPPELKSSLPTIEQLQGELETVKMEKKSQ